MLAGSHPTRTARGCFAGTLLFAASFAQPHPMGNMGISHYSELQVGAERVALQYVLDFAEIPTLAQMHRRGLVAGAGESAAGDFMRSLSAEISAGLLLSIDGRTAQWSAAAPCQGTFSAGAAGMLTLRVTCAFTAALPGGNAPYRMHFLDRNYPRRSGWKEVVLRTDTGVVVLASSVPASGLSDALQRYPENAAATPPQVVEAHATLQRTARAAAR